MVNVAAIVLGVLFCALGAGIIVYIIWRKKLTDFYRKCLSKFRIGQTQPDYVNCNEVSDDINTHINARDSDDSLAGVYTLATITADNVPSFHKNDSRRIKQDDKVDLIAAADDACSVKIDPIYTEPNAATANFQDDGLDEALARPTYDEPGVDVHGTGAIVVRTVAPTYSRQKYIGRTTSAEYVELEPSADDDVPGGKTEANKKTAAVKWNNSSLKANTVDRPRTKPKPMYSSLGHRPKISSGNEYNAPQIEGNLNVESDEDDLL